MGTFRQDVVRASVDDQEPNAALEQQRSNARKFNSWQEQGSGPRVGNVPPVSTEPDNGADYEARRQAALAETGRQATANVETEQARDPGEELDIARASSRSAFEARIAGTGRSPRRGGR